MPERVQKTLTQTRLEKLWSARLQISPIDLHDDFFELGGDSLTAAELQSDIDREFGVEISASTLFLSPTISELAGAIVAAVAAGSRLGAQPLEDVS
ncbi:phosphopantetheine-binding protein [Streptomyces sp. NPDC050263]|uniref:phosphopantetheine-binding protein n=1 Tax=Streptomyces sp. NPDC050263 TaxID=3155037 RepID=UPI00343A787D